MRLLPVIDRTPLVVGEDSAPDYVDLVIEITARTQVLDDGDFMEVADIAAIYEMAAEALKAEARFRRAGSELC